MTHPTEVKLPESLGAIRAALAAGPTKGPWIIQWGRQRRYPLGIHNGDVNIVTAIARPASNEATANALLFAACNPEAITALLDALKARDAEIERLRGDAERYQWLCANYGETKLPCMLEPAIGDYIADGKASIDAAIDQARAEGGEKTND